MSGRIKFDLVPPRGTRFEEIQERLRAPMRGPGGKAVAAAMRRGRGSVKAQFDAQTEQTRAGGRSPWPRTRAFGRRPAPARTLRRTGRLFRAWTGEGAGALTQITNDRVRIGVDRAIFPQAHVFQRARDTIVRPRKRGPRGRSAMGWFLGMRFGVWLSERRLARGLRLRPRRVSVNPEMLERAGDALTGFIVAGGGRTA